MKKQHRTVKCKGFLNDFDLAYSMLYEGDVHFGLVDYGNVVAKFDELMADEDFKSEVRDFVEYRGDIISSDREAAAFVLALYANGML